MTVRSLGWPALLLALAVVIVLFGRRALTHVPGVPGVRADPPVEESKPAVVSPRLAALAAELKNGRRAALDEFWKEVQGKAPLVEPMAGDSRRSWVTFVWRGDERTERVGLAGGPPPLSGRTPLTRLAGSDLWYRTENVRNDARFVYWFHVNFPDERPTDLASLDKLMSQFPPRSDPLNPRQYQKRSLVELAEAPPQPWVERLPGVARGNVSRHKIQSGILKQERELSVYTPPNYDPQGPECGLLVAFDGPPDEEPATLDNLIGRKRIAPMVAVFLTHIDRSGELSCSEPFADFLAAELVPWVRRNYRVSPDPGRTVVRGTSLGGLMASYSALRHAEVFGNVLSQSGSYQWFPGGARGTAPPDAEAGWLTRRFVTAPPGPRCRSTSRPAPSNTSSPLACSPRTAGSATSSRPRATRSVTLNSAATTIRSTGAVHSQTA